MARRGLYGCGGLDLGCLAFVDVGSSAGNAEANIMGSCYSQAGGSIRPISPMAK